VGDLKGYVDLALETAPFYRMGRAEQAAQLEAVLSEYVFPRLRPEVERVYEDLKGFYVELLPDLSAVALVDWGGRVLESLGQALRDLGMEPGFILDFSEKGEDEHA